MIKKYKIVCFQDSGKAVSYFWNFHCIKISQSQILPSDDFSYGCLSPYVSRSSICFLAFQDLIVQPLHRQNLHEIKFCVCVKHLSEYFLKQNVIKDCGELGLVGNKLQIPKTWLYFLGFSHEDSSIQNVPGISQRIFIYFCL